MHQNYVLCLNPLFILILKMTIHHLRTCYIKIQSLLFSKTVEIKILYCYRTHWCKMKKNATIFPLVKSMLIL